MSPGEPAPGNGRQPRIHRRRRTARRAAIDILYQADVMGEKPSHVLEQWRTHGRSVPAYTADLVTGVERDIRRIDSVLGSHAEDWTVQRMAVVDRTILRVACHELETGIPPAVAINEAVEAANELSTDDSGRFINGILGRMVRDMHGGPARGEPGEDEPLSPGRSGRESGLPRSRPPSAPS